MPAAYFRSICTRVMLARSDDFKDQTLNGVLLDFEFHVIDGITKPICTAVATDGARIHILRLPQMMIDVRATRLRALPPTCIVSAGFFEYMREIVQHEWVGLEFSAGQLVARGDDYVTVAKVSIEGRSSTRDLASWRKVNIEHPGHWLAAAPKIAQVVKSASLGDTAEECRLQIDGIKDRLTISSSNKSGDRFSESISVRGFDGPPLVDLNLSVPYLRDALLASQSGLVRLSFSHDLAIQATSPVVIRGEDEQFKAIIMPRAQESS
jgi:DNA polymerase III sliding clamp (beta) subunit (PCNA family)